jgi:hypothetical protein
VSVQWTVWTGQQSGGGVQVLVGSRICTSPHCPDWLWGPASLLSNRCQGCFTCGGLSRWSLKLTTLFQLVPRSTKCGSIHPLPLKSSRCSSAWLAKLWYNFTFHSPELYRLVLLQLTQDTTPHSPSNTARVAAAARPQPVCLISLMEDSGNVPTLPTVEEWDF